MLHGGDHRPPFGLVGEVAGVLHHAAGRDLLAADPGEQSLPVDVDARVDKRRRDVLGEVFQVVRQVLSGRGGHVDVVDFVDFTDCRESQMASDLR